MDIKSEPAQGESRTSATRKRRGGSRRKTGCVTCKSRHMRCDEKKPVCGNCVRLGLECQPAEFITPSVWWTPSLASQQLPSDQKHTALGSQKGQQGQQGQQGPVSTSSRFEENARSLTAPATSPIAIPYSLPGHDSVMEDSGGSAGLHSSPSLSSPGTELSVLGLTDEIVHLLTTYRSGTARWMDLFDHSCTYQREVCRRAVGSERLLYSICAFAAKQLSLLPSGSIWEQKATEYYTRSLNLLIKHIESETSRTENLTTIMILSSYEVLALQGPEHQRHFEGAMELIGPNGISARSSGLDRANFWIYIRHEVVVALLNEKPLRLNYDRWGWEIQDLTLLEEDMMGNCLLWLIGRAIDLNHSETADKAQWTALMSDINEWYCRLDPTFRGVVYEPSQSDDGLRRLWFSVPAAAAAMMWYHLLNLLLYAEFRCQPPSASDQIDNYALEILNISSSVLDEAVRVFSVVPLFFAAKHISGLNRKITIWKKLDDIQSQLGYHTRTMFDTLQQSLEPADFGLSTPQT